MLHTKVFFLTYQLLLIYILLYCAFYNLFIFTDQNKPRDYDNFNNNKYRQK